VPSLQPGSKRRIDECGASLSVAGGAGAAAAGRAASSSAHATALSLQHTVLAEKNGHMAMQMAAVVRAMRAALFAVFMIPTADDLVKDLELTCFQLCSRLPAFFYGQQFATCSCSAVLDLGLDVKTKETLSSLCSVRSAEHLPLFLGIYCILS
jgi:hypothetical protein